MTAMKRAVSPVRQATGADLQLSSPNLGGLPASTLFTRFVLNNLNLQNGEYTMFAMTFAPQIQIDCEAKVLDFDDYFHLLGHANKASALRTLLRTVPKDELVINKDVENSMGRPRDVYLLNVNQIEEVLLAANTDEGKKWRKLVLKIKNLVVQFMKMEMEAAANMAAEKEKLAQQQLELQKAQTQLQLEEFNAKRQELEAVQSTLQATIESQRKREEKKEARKKQQKEPLETAYIMTNMPDDSKGPYKCGKTGGDAKKRAQEMQTGNHEEMRVVASAKCVDSKLIEDVMHRIFRDYRTNDKLEWFDTKLTSMSSVLKFVVRVIDGLNCIDHVSFSVEEALDEVMLAMEEKVFRSAPSFRCNISLAERQSQSDDHDAGGNADGTADEALALDCLDRWLVQAVETESLPYAIYGDPLIELVRASLSTSIAKSITRQWFSGRMKDYIGKGVCKKCTKSGTVYSFDYHLLKATLVAQNKLDPDATPDVP